MTSIEIRKAFLDFFSRKAHEIVPSAPMVVKNDPTLMFTNAGMNQFKDIFLGQAVPEKLRVANSQKCLRVSGKHNDLEEVGHDTYHHTMFEMLGNWSFGDYFKKEAISWAWEFLTAVLGIDSARLYVTVYGGDENDKLAPDREAMDIWKTLIPESRILTGSKKDNFWEMGDTGPCGPCSEIHVDLRNEDERRAIDGSELVNKDNPLVIEIWNLVFIQYNRKANGDLEALPNRHVDTGMGFERLCMVVQGKLSNYDTDIFQHLIGKIAEFSGIRKDSVKETTIAMRVIADHLRAIAFAIADGQLPSNVRAGYVIRRILRRAVRYAYTFLNQNSPFMYRLVPELVSIMGDSYPELAAQEQLIVKVIREEEHTFLRTLEKGISLLDQIIEKTLGEDRNMISGKVAFELYDTYGFPLDLTQLILKEHHLGIVPGEFEKEMEKQKSRSREDAAKETEDWIHLVDHATETLFAGYDNLELPVKITRYRKIKQKGTDYYQVVFDRTPFYAESGGQVGDTGYIRNADEKIRIINTVKEHNLTIHLTEKMPADPEGEFLAVVNKDLRISTANNHTATHLLHNALRQVLGTHVEQKGSLVHPDYLRFDFAHFQKVTGEEIREIEKMVNHKIREDLSLREERDVPLEKAREMGAIALFGEKYGDKVRVIGFGDSVELCGGTHVRATGQIGFFKILKESGIAAGIRRIEAVTGEKAEEFIFRQYDTLSALEQILPAGKNVIENVEKLLVEHTELGQRLDKLEREKLSSLKKELKQKAELIGDVVFIGAVVEVENAGALKDLAFQLKGEIENLFLILGTGLNDKANLAMMISDTLVIEKQLDAAKLIRECAVEIRGGGGGQPFFATAGGKDPGGLQRAIGKARTIAGKL